ncbi:MAG TPA: L-2-hydroxyglutarate oxidase [Candidatus Hydrogenedentes bacterium]|jgi:L-2-hydroxyglutarate oxidase|nr:L-2-hydroxyglutarate oxidase [Candidatus Hydrogenedentota bacterium]
MDCKLRDLIIIGGGIVGVAAARMLARECSVSILLLEAEKHLAAHQTGRNSGVIHSGLYYRPGSMKAKTCREGRETLYRFCEEKGVPHERCGKVVVAVTEKEKAQLAELARRGEANGLTGIRLLDRAGLQAHEPHAEGVAALHVPETGIVDFSVLTQRFAEEAQVSGAEIRTGVRVTGCEFRDGLFHLDTDIGERFCARTLINTAGLHCDEVAQLCGLRPDIRIIPFRGEYYTLKPERAELVNHLIYPVPDPRFPFLGVHFTRRIGGGIEAGPNAVLAMKREGYSWKDWGAGDLASMLSWPGFWRMGAKYWNTGLQEMYRSFSRRSFARALARLVPEIKETDLQPGGAGVRAQAVDRQGRLLDDFHILEGKQMLHVLNAPSPAATASLAIGRTIRERACALFGFSRRKG